MSDSENYRLKSAFWLLGKKGADIGPIGGRDQFYLLLVAAGEDLMWGAGTESAIPHCEQSQ